MLPVPGAPGTQNQGLKTTETSSLTVLEAEIPKKGVSKATLPLRALRRNCPRPLCRLLEVMAILWFLGSQQQHFTSASVPTQPPLSLPSLLGHVTEFRFPSPTDPAGPHLNQVHPQRPYFQVRPHPGILGGHKF